MQARGTLTELSWVFDGTNDSAGVPWDSDRTLESYDIRVGTKMLSLVTDLASAGQCEWWVDESYELHVVQTAGIDHTSWPDGPRVVAGQNLTEASLTDVQDLDQFGTIVLVEGVTDEEGNEYSYWDRERASQITNFGRWEAFVSQVSVESDAAAQQVAGSMLNKVSRTTSELAVAVQAEIGSQPFTDFDPLGDWITVMAPADGINGEQRQCRGVSLEFRADVEPSWLVILGDLYLGIRGTTHHRLRALDQRNNPEFGRLPFKGPNRQAPAVPTSLAHVTTVWQQDGQQTAETELTWVRSLNADGTYCYDLAYFIVQYKRSSATTVCTAR